MNFLELSSINMIRMTSRTACCLTILLALSSSCHVGPKYQPPCPETPIEWKAPHKNPEVIPCVDYWWEVFEDDLLDQLEREAICNNPNLYISLQRVLEARALAHIRKADLYPQLTLNPSYLDTGMLFKLFTPPGVQLGPGISNGLVFRVHQFNYVLPLNMSYELDLWGKIKGQYASALMNAQAQQEAYNTTLLGLTTDLASSYFLTRSLDAQINFYQESLKELGESYRIAKSRFDGGLGNYLDVATASLQFTNAEADLFDLVRQRALQEDKIAVLLGRPPAQFCLSSNPLKSPPPEIPAGIPATVLLQRPDIAQAERILASQQALIGVAYASILPSINLTGTLGFSSPTLKDFLHWISRLWAIGVNMSQPVYDGGRIDANIDLAWSQFREAGGAYQQQVLTAFQEVEDALNNLDLQEKQAESLSQSSMWAKKAAMLSLNRYKKGLTNYLEVTVNQKAYLDTERNFINLEGVRYLSTIQLIKAIGGTWEQPLFEAATEEPSGTDLSQNGNHCHGPKIAPDDSPGHSLKENPFHND